MIESRFIEKLLKNREIEFKSLGDVTEMKRGKTITAKDASGGDIPVISGGQKPAYYHNEYNRNGKTITVAGSGAYAGFIMYWEEPIFVSDAFSIKSDETLLDLKYVYHFLLQHQQKIYGMKKGSGVPHVYPKDLSTLVIPIPPLDVQQEIVRILDAFTSLTAELTAELTSRQKQYQYFRDKLLNFDDISDRGGYETNSITKALLHNKKVVFKALGNISENLDFMRKPITSGLREKGNIPYYGASGIVDYVKDYIFEGDYLLVSEDGANLLARNTPIAFSISGKNWVNNHAHVLKFNTYTERRFVEFYLNNIDLTPYISGASQPKLNKNNLSNIKIPAPPFEEQQRIVTILDKFETLTNSIAEGLPKEIELRRKQYEYYREKLLSFSQ
ncbi:restriction endonuclease subunit S [Glaesserella parasuis]|uniref:restriction endonuclease subunit S n=2 Tax=Glaesserella parasuis TaxID=738 RepID=UPI00243724B0|nr:restriction endonuclease subunit S [Glaesserella parasuis]MDG6269023.1 restriction endonuclease subunit S [Glaesserella parasuis]MDG6304826.1 restriction endonuclease subunit S [Glaesserella parasuis]MDO9675257.1 restriction endonuclease subunit S [Glaesserella parasuis]MDO9691341.1 restriction endonuclease subunit S [Glaesserella parasuis]MDO9759706.1 restriction endonuclease subunit S [Glaesserella parasuis]